MTQDNIELMVDEPIPGHYYWMLLKDEGPEHYPRVVDCAPGPLPGYAAAMMAGIAALQRRADARGDADPAAHGPVVINAYTADAAIDLLAPFIKRH